MVSVKLLNRLKFQRVTKSAVLIEKPTRQYVAFLEKPCAPLYSRYLKQGFSKASLMILDFDADFRKIRSAKERIATKFLLKLSFNYCLLLSCSSCLTVVCV